MIKVLVGFVFFFCLIAVEAQEIVDTTFYDQNMEEIGQSAPDGYYAIRNKSNPKRIQATYFTTDRLLYSIQIERRGKRRGKCIWYHDNARVSQEGDYKNDRPIGEHHFYDVSGVHQRTDIYNKRHKKIAEYYKTESGKVVYSQADRLSSFGDFKRETKAFRAMSEFISAELEHPAIVEDLVETVVVVDFLVNPNGELEEVQFINTAHPELEQEVRELMKKMPKWSPAIYAGTPVYSAFSIAVSF